MSFQVEYPRIYPIPNKLVRIWFFFPLFFFKSCVTGKSISRKCFCELIMTHWHFGAPKEGFMVEFCIQIFFFFFFFGWCCHGDTTQEFYSENIRYKYHMQSWIWIWSALITSCSDYHTDVVWNPPLMRAVIGLSKCSSSLDPAKFGRRKERQKVNKAQQKQPSQTSQKGWAPVWVKDEKKKTAMQALKCKLMHHEVVHKLEHDIIPRYL